MVLETAVAGDVPGVKESELSLGEGPALTIVDASGRGLIAHPKVRRLLIEVAEREDIPYQLEVGEGGTTDATAIHLTRGGVPSGVVGVPTRYLLLTLGGPRPQRRGKRSEAGQGRHQRVPGRAW